MLMPLSTAQLLHAFLFDRDSVPKVGPNRIDGLLESVNLTLQKSYGDFILKHTPHYVQPRPALYPVSLPWPNTTTIIDSLAEISRLRWP